MYPERLLNLIMELIEARPASISGKWCIVWLNALPQVIAYEHRQPEDQILMTIDERDCREGFSSKQWAEITEKVAELWEPERSHID